MKYYIDGEKITIDQVMQRIQDTDLVPSRVSLLDGIELAMHKLRRTGVTTLAALRKAIKTTKQLEVFSERAEIDKQYLVLLRREIEGYFPKSIALKKMEWVPVDQIAALESQGIKNCATLFEITSNIHQRKELEDLSTISNAVLEDLIHLADLTRVRWVSATAARMLLQAGYDTAASLATASAHELHEDLIRVNEENGFFKGTIGLRDIKRLIQAAGYVENWSMV